MGFRCSLTTACHTLYAVEFDKRKTTEICEKESFYLKLCIFLGYAKPFSFIFISTKDFCFVYLYVHCTERLGFIYCSLSSHTHNYSPHGFRLILLTHFFSAWLFNKSRFHFEFSMKWKKLKMNFKTKNLIKKKSFLFPPAILAKLTKFIRLKMTSPK